MSDFIDLSDVLLFPTALGKIAACAADPNDDSFRRVSGVRLSRNKDGQLIATATDGQVGVYVVLSTGDIVPKAEAPRFPNLAAVVPKTKPALTFVVNPERMIRVLKAAAEFSGVGDVVTVELRIENLGVTPIVIRAGSAETGQFTGLVIPRNVFTEEASA